MEFELFPTDPLNPGFGWTARWGAPDAWRVAEHLSDAEARQLHAIIKAFFDGKEA